MSHYTLLRNTEEERHELSVARQLPDYLDCMGLLAPVRRYDAKSPCIIKARDFWGSVHELKRLHPGNKFAYDIRLSQHEKFETLMKKMD